MKNQYLSKNKKGDPLVLGDIPFYFLCFPLNDHLLFDFKYK